MSTNRGSRILIVQDNNFDYTEAEKHGTVEFITSQDWSAFANSPRNEDIANSVRAAFIEYIPVLDKIVFTGSPLNAAVVVSEMLKYGKRHVILKWDNRKLEYFPVVMDFPT